MFESVDWSKRGRYMFERHGVNGWPSNEKDRRIYQEATGNGQA